MTDQEIWKDIKGYEGLYQVSDMGNVRSLDRLVDRGGKPLCAIWKGRVLKKKKASDNYYSVVLSKNNVQLCVRIHRLVAETFIPNPNNLPEVNHRNENKLDNRVENLEWCDRLYNVRYGTGIERAVKTRSKKKSTILV